MLFPGCARKFPFKITLQMAAGSVIGVIGPGGDLAVAFTAQSYFRSSCNEGFGQGQIHGYPNMP